MDDKLKELFEEATRLWRSLNPSHHNVYKHTLVNWRVTKRISEGMCVPGDEQDARTVVEFLKTGGTPRVKRGRKRGDVSTTEQLSAPSAPNGSPPVLALILSVCHHLNILHLDLKRLESASADSAHTLTRTLSRFLSTLTPEEREQVEVVVEDLVRKWSAS